MQEFKAVLAGFGGQGILFAGKVLANCGMIDDKEISWLPSYGPEMRGGTANCSVTLSDRRIGSPLVTQPNIFIAMNQPSFDKFIDAVEPGGIVIADSGLIPQMKQRSDITIYKVAATQIAEDNGLKGLGNIVLIGKLFEISKFCSFETLQASIKKCCPAKKPEMFDLNMKAVELGRNA